MPTIRTVEAFLSFHPVHLIQHRVRSRRWLLCSVVLALLASSAACSRASTAPSPQLSIDFRGLWFSADDAKRISAGQANIGPSLDVGLVTWDATGRLHTAHPDIVNAEIRIRNDEDAPRYAAVVTLREEWKIGTAGSEVDGRWGERQVRTSQLIDLGPGQTVTVSLPVEVGSTVRRLVASGQVPWRLAVRVDLRESANRHTLAMTRATLPIVTARPRARRR